MRCEVSHPVSQEVPMEGEHVLGALPVQWHKSLFNITAWTIVVTNAHIIVARLTPAIQSDESMRVCVFFNDLLIILTEVRQMATATVKGYLTIRKMINHDSVQISGSTFIEVIRKLVSEYPELKSEVLNEDMNLKGNYIYLLNGRNVEYLDKEETLIKDGDRIAIFPPIGGG